MSRLIVDLAKRLDEMGRRWGFDVKLGSNPKYHNFYLYPDGKKAYYLAFIVNNESLLFYFRAPLRKVIGKLEALISTAGLVPEVNRQEDYEVRIENEAQFSLLVQMIDRSIVKHLGLAPLEQATPRAEHLPAEELPSDVRYVEGAAHSVLVNAYERNRRARLVCIGRYGNNCAVCNFNFGARYGESAAGFIQVHHIVPIATVGKEYSLDPIADLRPVCPNCHAVIHRREPPFSIEEVTEMIQRP